MAKQAGIVKLKGTIDDISFYKSADGHLARAKGGVSRNKILNDPAFQRTRENINEFGAAGKGGKVIRTAIRHLLQNAKDRRVVSRLTTNLLAVIKTDAVNPRGLRTIEDGDLNRMVGFNFNANAPLGGALFAPYRTAFDRLTGEAVVQLDAFVSNVRVSAPQGTTHFRINAATVEVDFTEEIAVVDSTDTGYVEYNADTLPATVLATEVSAASSLPVFQVLGVEFFQEVNGDYYPLKNGAHNALAIVNIETI